MPYPFNESFETGIPTGFGASGGAGGITATWNSTAQAVDLVFSSSLNFWKITSAPQSSDFWFEMDVEITAAIGSPYFGFWLWDGIGTYEGHRVCVINAYWAHSYWGISGAEYDHAEYGYAGWAIVGARRTLRLDVKRTSTDIWQFQLTVSGIVVWQESKRWYTTLMPCVFGSSTSLRLHRAAGGTPSTLGTAPVIGSRVLKLKPARRILVAEHAAARFKHHGLRNLVGMRNHYYQGAYQIMGTVKEKGPQVDLPVSRRVLLIDERANLVVRETWSNALTGEYEFKYINPEIQYLVISYDYKKNFRAAIADNVTAEPMS